MRAALPERRTGTHSLASSERAVLPSCPVSLSDPHLCRIRSTQDAEPILAAFPVRRFPSVDITGHEWQRFGGRNWFADWQTNSVTLFAGLLSQFKQPGRSPCDRLRLGAEPLIGRSAWMNARRAENVSALTANIDTESDFRGRIANLTSNGIAEIRVPSSGSSDG